MNSCGPASGETLAYAVHTLLDKDGNYYAGWGTTVYKIADETHGDINSPLKIVASYDLKDGLPADKAHKVHLDVLFTIVKMAGQSDDMVADNAKKMILLYYGRVALKHGYSSSSEDIEIDDEHYLKFFDLNI